MKTKIIILIVAFLSSFVNYAQIDRSKAPEGGKAPSIKIPNAKTFKLKNGLTVILVENHKLPTVYFGLKINVGPYDQGDKVGFLEMMGGLMKDTKNYTKEKFNEESETLAINLNSNYSGGSMSSLKKNYKKGVEMMSEMILHPRFKQSELDKSKKKVLSGIKAGENDPSTIYDRVSRLLLYEKNHIYSKYATEKTINNIKLKDYNDYHKKYFVPNNSYMFVIGDINQKETKKIVNKYFGNWKKGKIYKYKVKQPKPIQKTRIAFIDLPDAKQAKVGVFNLHSLKPNHKDVFMTKLANKVLGGGSSGRLFLNLREDKSWTYGSYSDLTPGKFMGDFIAQAQTRNEVADSAAVEILSEIKKITKKPITQEELKIAKMTVFGSMIRQLENKGTVADFKYLEIVNKLPKGFYNNYLKNINKVTVKDIQQKISKYIKPDNALVVIVGKASVIVPNLERWNIPVTYYDKYANPVSKPKIIKASDVKVTAKEVLKNYIQKIGGRKNIEKIKSIVNKQSISMVQMPQPMEYIQYFKLPNKVKIEIIVNGNVFQKEVYNGKKGYIQSSMGKQDLPKEEIEDYNLGVIKQLNYEKFNYNLEIVGVEKVKKSDAYKVKITSPQGKSLFEYYDIKTGFLVKQEVTKKVQGQEMVQSFIFLDYKKVKEGILVPHKIDMSVGPQKMNSVVTEILINTQIDDKEFE